MSHNISPSSLSVAHNILGEFFEVFTKINLHFENTVSTSIYKAFDTHHDLFPAQKNLTLEGRCALIMDP